jgi:serine/threonine protein kinase
MKFDTVIATSKNKAIYRDGESCVKLFDELYSKADVLNEALNHARIEETGLNIPKIHEVKLVDGRWAIILEYIEGKTLAQLMEENPEKKNEYIEVTVATDNEMTTAEGATLAYTITKDGNALENDVVATFTTDKAEQSSTIHIAASDPDYAGDYKDTVTFTLTVKSN